MYIFFSEMVEIQLIINFGGHWEGSISRVHGMVEADCNSFVYEIRSLLNAYGKTVKLQIKNDRDVQFAIKKLMVYCKSM